MSGSTLIVDIGWHVYGAVVRVDLDVVEQGVLRQVDHVVDIEDRRWVESHHLHVFLTYYFLIVHIFKLQKKKIQLFILVVHVTPAAMKFLYLQ